MIGLSTTNIESCLDWLEFLTSRNINIIELNHRYTPIFFDEECIVKLKRAIIKNKINITIHSGVTYLLHPDSVIAKAQLLEIKSEIIFASKAGIKYIVFHLHPMLDYKNKAIFTLLDLILSYADKHSITLCLENDGFGPLSKPDILVELFKKYDLLRHVVDIGHLNVSIHNNKKITFSNYLSKLDKYIEYFHFHDNNGEKDEHNEIGKGNINFNEIFNYINKSQKNIISETHNFQAALNSIKLLKNFT